MFVYPTPPAASAAELQGGLILHCLIRNRYNNMHMSKLWRSAHCLLVIVLLITLLAAFSRNCRAGGVDTSTGVLVATKAGQSAAAEEAAVDLADLTDGSIKYAASYDARGLNISVQVKAIDAPRNQNDPIDRSGWKGDCIQLRLDPDQSGRLYDFTFWYHHVQKKAYWTVSRDQKPLENVTSTSAWVTARDANKLEEFPGIAADYKTDAAGYSCNLMIPWGIFGLKASPADGASWPALLEVLLGNADGTDTRGRCVALYTRHPGVFGFQRRELWGKIVFGGAAEKHKSLAQLQQESRQKQSGGMKIDLILPAEGQVSVNILDKDGRIVRELVSESTQPAGPCEMTWNALDWAGHRVAPGAYRWVADIHPAISAKYLGSVGSSGLPPYETADGTGGWGSDHCNPLDVAVDAAGARYFLWRSISEMGMSLVKLDAAGKTLWRVRPPNHTGFGDFWSVAVDDRFAYTLIGATRVELCRVLAATGRSAAFDNGQLFIPVGTKDVPVLTKIDPPRASGTGLAVRGGLAYISLYHENAIAVVDISKSAVVKRWNLARPCGLAFDSAGNLYAVSQSDHGGVVVVYRNAQEPAQPLITSELIEPWDVAVLNNDQSIGVTDMAPDVNQVVIFTLDGRVQKRLGTKGGRTGYGAYQPESLLRPAGIAATRSGGLIVCEDSIPKAITEYSARGEIIKKWYGPTAYGGFVVPDAQDPTLLYTLGNYATPGYLIRSQLDLNTGKWSGPLACWDFSRDPKLKVLPDFFGASGVPQMLRFKGHDFMCSGFTPQTLLRMDGDTLRPVATLREYVDRRPKIDYYRAADKPAGDGLDLNLLDGYLLEGESFVGGRDAAPAGVSPVVNLPRVFSAGNKGDWTDTIVSGRVVANLQGAFPLSNHHLRWTLPGAPKAGRYELYAHFAHASDAIYLNTGVSVGAAESALRQVVPASFRQTAFKAYEYGWMNLGAFELAPDDRVVQWDLVQINSQQVIVDGLVLRYTQDLTPAPGPQSFFGHGIDDEMNLYYQGGRKIIRIPCAGADADGNPRWEPEQYKVLVNDYCPAIPDVDLENTWRRQVRGIMVDKARNLYVLWNAGPESSGPHWAAHITYSRLTKYTPDGKFVWEVGMKAMGPRRHGEMYNSHVLAGILNDRYIAIADETGMMHFYTLDGHYRGHLFNDIGRPVAPGPFTFTGETFAGRVAYQEKTGRSFAYSGNTDGRMFEVLGLGDENRAQGTLAISEDMLASLDAAAGTGRKVSGKWAVLADSATADLSTDKWINAVPFIFSPANGAGGRTFVGHNRQYVLMRFEVSDDTPWRNAADNPLQAFKTGDAVDLYVGPAGKRNAPAPGDVRIMLAPDERGGVNVIGYKPFTDGPKQPQNFATLVLSYDFQWAGKIPGAVARVERADRGYTVEAAVPLAFFEKLPLTAGNKIRFDADILSSDDSGRKTMQRSFLFSRGAEVSMVSDLPTESWLYPAKWPLIYIGGMPSDNKNHLDPQNLFDEASAEYFEAENAPRIPSGFNRLAKFQGNIDKLYNGGALPTRFTVSWDLDGSMTGKQKMFVSWAKSGNMQAAKFSVRVGADAQHLRDIGTFSATNPISYTFGWHKAPFDLALAPEDRILEVTVETSSPPQAQFYFDSVALLPY